MYTLLLAIIYLIFISLGLPDSLLGSAWPVMRAEFNMPISAAGIISMIISGGTIFSSLMSERLTKKFKTQYVTIISVFLTAIALLGFSFSTHFYMLCFWAIPYGLGAGAIDSAINNYVALYYNSRHMSWLHCFWGVGTIFSPYIMSLALTYSTWNNGYRIVSFIQLSIVAILFFTLPLWKKVKHKRNIVEQTDEVLGLKNAIRIKGVIYIFIGFFAYCAAEGTAMLWASSYLYGTRNISEQTAAAFGSLFFIGITVGRFISGLIADKLGDHNMIRLGAFISILGIIFMLLPLKADLLALCGLIIFGIGCAPVYPSIIHSTPNNFGEQNSQAIIGMQMASAYVGTTFMPPLFGVIANRIGLSFMPIFLFVFIFLMIIMIEITFKTVKNKSQTN